MSAFASEPSSFPVDSFDRLPYGTHLCHLYRGERELFSAAVPFIRAGLNNHERCLWVTSDPAVLRRRVGGGDGELEALFDSGQIDIVHQRAWHGNASLRCLEAVAAGYRGLRVASDMACLGAEPLAGQIVALCSYPIEGCSSRDLLDLLHAHPLALVRDGSGWSQVDTGLLWARDDVLAMVSHELKTPLTSLRLRIDGLVRRVRGDQASREEIEERLIKALEQCDRLGALIANLIDASRAGVGKLSVMLEPGDLGRIVEDSAERFGEEFGHRGGSLTIVAESIPGLWDRTRIEQVVGNLVANTLRHAPGAPVEVRATRHGGVARIEVRDRGPGIASEQLDNLFQRFAPHGPRPGGGLGIGLWIVREIVTALGGTVAVASGAGQGCAFTVALPSGEESTTSSGAMAEA
jgi:signal transduction histidine kinase